jgi:hypothetical protein
MNTIPMSITQEAIQDLLDELEASKQSRLRAWSVQQKTTYGSLGGGKRRDSFRPLRRHSMEREKH